MKKKLIKGFLPDVIKESDWEFGSEKTFGAQILVADGNWEPYLPALEIQKNRFMDSWSCVSYAILNGIEALAKRLFDVDWNKSDRFISNISGTIPGKGNSPSKVLDAITHNGLVPEEVFPFTEDMSEKEYFNKSAITPQIKQIGKDFLKDYEIQYSWVVTNSFNKEKTLEALKYSPLPTAVDFGSPVSGGIIQPKLPNGYNHFELLIRGEKNVKWITYNSYENCFKQYHWNYLFYPPRMLNLVKYGAKADLSLVRDGNTGKIYLMDSDQVLHWIITPEVFKIYFGESAWNNHIWQNLSHTDMLPLLKKVGEPISGDKKTLSMQIKDTLKKIGYESNT
jgi:hypothetical protein